MSLPWLTSPSNPQSQVGRTLVGSEERGEGSLQASLGIRCSHSRLICIEQGTMGQCQGWAPESPGREGDGSGVSEGGAGPCPRPTTRGCRGGPQLTVLKADGPDEETAQAEGGSHTHPTCHGHHHPVVEAHAGSAAELQAGGKRKTERGSGHLSGPSSPHLDFHLPSPLGCPVFPSTQARTRGSCSTPFSLPTSDISASNVSSAFRVYPSLPISPLSLLSPHLVQPHQHPPGPLHSPPQFPPSLLSSLQQPPGGGSEHLTQALPLLCPQSSRTPPLGVKAQALQVALKALHDHPCPLPALPSYLFPPHSLCSCHMGFLTVPPPCQA